MVLRCGDGNEVCSSVIMAAAFQTLFSPARNGYAAACEFFGGTRVATGSPARSR
jgi:hypothetical protein